MKKLIRNYLKKKLTSHPKHYYFLRWLAEIIKNTEDTNLVCSKTGCWLADNIQQFKTHLVYNDIFVVDKNVYIYTYRPGLWIGKGGQTVYSLEDRINKDNDGNKVYDFEVHFIELHKTNCNKVMNAICAYLDY